MKVLLVFIGIFTVGVMYFSPPSAEAGPPKENAPAKIVATGDGSMPEVILTARAAERIGIETDNIESSDENGQQQNVIPYGAMLYDKNGASWIYTNPRPLVFVRHPVVIDRIDDDNVMLLDGPPVGTEIVTTGIAELYGVERGIGK